MRLTNLQISNIPDEEKTPVILQLIGIIKQIPHAGGCEGAVR
jgi:hypothetical protein